MLRSRPQIHRLIQSIALMGLMLLTGFVQQSLAQEYGCTDPNANNYNAEATNNDGSCTYSTTFYNPSLRYNLPGSVAETSGLAFFRGGIWTINDGGNTPVLFHLDTTDGSVLQTIFISNAMNVDWEDLAQDEDYLYIGDFGNNLGNRDELVIYKVEKSIIPMAGDAQVHSNTISYRYEDYVSIPEKKGKHNFDCEAMLAGTDYLYLFSKNRSDFKTKRYRVPKEPGNYEAELLDEFDVKGMITAADMHPDGSEIALLGYTDFPYTPFVWLLFDFNDDQYFSGNKRRIDMPNVVVTQTEAFAYTVNKSAIISSEKTPLGSQRAFNMNTHQWTNMTPSDITDFVKADFNFVLSPNPISKGKLSLVFSNLDHGSYQIEVFDTLGNLLVVKNHWAKKSKEGIRIKLKVSHLKKGLYIVRVISDNKVLEKKFIKE